MTAGTCFVEQDHVSGDAAVGPLVIAESSGHARGAASKHVGRQACQHAKLLSSMSSFRLGDAETTKQVLVEHLVCACTGLPRQDMEWILEFGAYTPESTMELLGTMQPTSEFGEIFQYSNMLASAAGYVGAYVLHPEHELGRAYDIAMELASGRLPDGERYIGEAALLERRKPKVRVSEDHWYGQSQAT